MQSFPTFQTVKQETLSDCGAAVAAMACGRTLEHAKSLMKSASHDGRVYYRTSEAVRYLASHGMLMGLHLEVQENPLRPAEDHSIPWKMEWIKNKEAITLANEMARSKGQPFSEAPGAKK